MDIYIDIAVVILCLSVTVLCWYLIAAISKSRETLTQLSDTARSVQREITDLNTRITPILDDINTVTSKARHIAENISDQAGSLKNAAKTASDIMDDLRRFEQNAIRTIDDPFSLITKYGKAAVRALKAFIDMMRND